MRGMGMAVHTHTHTRGACMGELLLLLELRVSQGVRRVGCAMPCCTCVPGHLRRSLGQTCNGKGVGAGGLGWRRASGKLAVCR